MLTFILGTTEAHPNSTQELDYRVLAFFCGMTEILGRESLILDINSRGEGGRGVEGNYVRIAR
jgi:hypothetical protein